MTDHLAAAGAAAIARATAAGAVPPAAVTHTINGVAFDINLGADPGTTIVAGYNAASRAALTGDALAKVREKAIKSPLTDKFTKDLRISSFDPASMSSKNSFFHFVGSWQSSLLTLSHHLKVYYMETPFTIVRLQVNPGTRPTDAEIADYQTALSIFMTKGTAVSIHTGIPFNGRRYANPRTLPADWAWGGGDAEVFNRPAEPTGTPDTYDIVEVS